MSTRTAVRQRYPDLGKELQIIRTYEKYVKFEMELNEPGRVVNGFSSNSQRVQELKQESAKTLEALRGKQAVRIPDLAGPKTTSNEIDNCIVDVKVGRFVGGNKTKPFKKAHVQENQCLYPIQSQDQSRN